MNYSFPEIVDFEPDRKVVADADGVTIIRKPGPIAVCYADTSPEVFPRGAVTGSRFAENCGPAAVESRTGAEGSGAGCRTGLGPETGLVSSGMSGPRVAQGRAHGPDRRQRH